MPSVWNQLNQTNQNLIELFLDALWLESGLSKNTLAAYRSDLAGFALTMQPKDLLQADQADLQSYLATLLSQATKASSSARFLSTVRRFYRYQVREGKLGTDPSADIRSPSKAGPCQNRSQRRKLKRCCAHQRLEPRLDCETGPCLKRSMQLV